MNHASGAELGTATLVVDPVRVTVADGTFPAHRIDEGAVAAASVVADAPATTSAVAAMRVVRAMCVLRGSGAVRAQFIAQA